MKKIIPLFFVFVWVLLAAAGCAKGEEEEASSLARESGAAESQTSTSTVQKEEDKKEETGFPAGTAENHLTGLAVKKEYQNKRPVAVMINNIKQAQPLLGVSKADVIYECVVEGGITRLMAVYQDPSDVPLIGSIRSARPYYINLACGMDAVYMHIGSSTQAQQLLNSGMVDSFNLGTSMFWRDATRRANLGYEHSAVTSGEMLLNGMAASGIRTDMKEGYQYPNAFSKTSPVQGGKSATSLTAKFSGYKTTSFSYDSANETYLISQFGAPQMDGSANVQNSKQNVLLIEANTYSLNDESGHMGIDIIGSGTGYYMSRGKIIAIRWSKPSAQSPVTYQTERGEALVLLPGQSYVCVLPLNAQISYQ